jgi:hypothetical protein
VAQEVAMAVQQPEWDVWVCQPWHEAATEMA